MREISILAFVSIDGFAQGPTPPAEDTSGGFAHSGWMADDFDDLLAKALRCLSHRPLLSGYDEQQTLS